jgi:hypothetical protein
MALEENATDQLNLIEKARQRTGALRRRMDDDFKLYSMAEYHIPREEGKWDSYTANDPAVISQTVSTLLGTGALRKSIPIKYEKKQDRKQIAKTENLVTGLMAVNDERLVVSPELPRLQESLAWNSTVRGWIGIRAVVYVEEGNLIPDFVTWDIRNTYWLSGTNGLIWAAYQRWTTEQDVKDEYTVEVQGDEHGIV